MIIRYKREDELYHFGIPGMKWYRRRFQNEDGSYTKLGMLRYGIGQKGRETGKMMSDWSRRVTSKEASNASKMHATPSGKSYFDNPHMLYNGNVRKAARSLMDEYAQASRKNGQPIARASKPSLQYAKDRMRTMARSIDGNDEARVVAARSQYPGEKMRSWDDRLSQYMWNYTTKNPEQGDKAREKAFTPVMSRSDNTKLYLQGAKNLAGNYARYAKEGLSSAGKTIRDFQKENGALATARQLGYEAKGYLGEKARDRLDDAAFLAGTAGAIGKGLASGAGVAAKYYGGKAKEGLTGAAASALAAKNGLQYRAQEAAGNARKGAGAFGEIMKAYGKEIGGNANSAVTRYLDAANKRATGDPGEDRDKLDPNARSRYDTRLTDAIKTAANLRNIQPKKEDVNDYTARVMAANARMLDSQRARYNQKYGGRVPPFGNFRTLSNDEIARNQQRNAETAARAKAGESETRTQQQRFEQAQSQRRGDLLNPSFRQFMNNQKWVERAYGDDVPDSVKDQLLEEWRKGRHYLDAVRR